MTHQENTEADALTRSASTKLSPVMRELESSRNLLLPQHAFLPAQNSHQWCEFLRKAGLRIRLGLIPLRAVVFSCARIFILSLMTLAWGAGFFHTSLEAAGWLLEHEHHHPAYHDPAHDHSHEHMAGDGDDHEPLWAAQPASQSALLLAVIAALLLAPLFPLARWALSALLRTSAHAAASPRWRINGSHTRDPVWHFVRRCAPDIAAPPLL